MGLQRGRCVAAAEFAVHFGCFLCDGRWEVCCAVAQTYSYQAYRNFLLICVDIKNTWLYMSGLGWYSGTQGFHTKARLLTTEVNVLVTSHVCSSLGHIKVKKPHLSLSCALHCDSHLEQSLFLWLSLSTRAFLKCFWEGFHSLS